MRFENANFIFHIFGEIANIRKYRKNDEYFPHAGMQLEILLNPFCTFALPQVLYHLHMMMVEEEDRIIYIVVNKKIKKDMYV